VHASGDGKSAKVWRQVKLDSTIFEIGDVWEDEQTCHKKLRCLSYPRRSSMTVMVGGKRQAAGFDRAGNLEFATTAKDAPFDHFNVPLTPDLYRDQQPLQSGEDLTAVVRTPGIGPGTFALFFCDAYPRNAWPKAVIEYPAKDGGKPIVTTVRLDDN